MITMQYKVVLPDDYDMNKICNRVLENGCKTDGFKGLCFKAYLMSETKDNENGNNEYSPFYLWNDSEGMNEFIFHGFYDNILQSFGWQSINIGVSYQVDMHPDFMLAAYMIEIEKDISKCYTMKELHFSLDSQDAIGRVLLYNPEHWKCVEYYFYKEKPKIEQGSVYKVLHISLG